MNKNLPNLIVLSGILLGSTAALAQPRDPYDNDPPPTPPAAEPAAEAPAEPPAAGPTAGPTEAPAEAPAGPAPAAEPAVLEEVTPTEDLAAQPRPPDAVPSPQPALPIVKKNMNMRAPQLRSVPTAHLLPAAMIYSTASIDTGGSLGASVRVGLGDVGEFGLETSPLIRMIPEPGETVDTVQPMIFATFKMGVGEERLFKGQPALALGFKKSFNREFEGNKIRAAAIEMTASKTFGKVSLHGGGVFWDAELDEQNGRIAALHDDQLGIKRQIRPFGGIEAEPIQDAQLLVDVAWVPLFRPGEDRLADRMALRPALSWGIRYVLSDAISLESGVRVPDIGEANLLDAQIFGQFTWASDKLRRGLGIK